MDEYYLEHYDISDTARRAAHYGSGIFNECIHDTVGELAVFEYAPFHHSFPNETNLLKDTH